MTLSFTSVSLLYPYGNNRWFADTDVFEMLTFPRNHYVNIHSRNEE